MRMYSYRIDHDYGLAPNPFGGYCTVAVCKPNIRRSSNLKINDWLIGTGSKSLERSSGIKCITNLIYAMQITEIIDLNSYWNDPRFQYKKPQMDGTLTTIFGDNFYHLDADGNWIQDDCAHRNISGLFNKDHFRKDTEGRNVLISTNFFYFGDNAPEIPNDFISVCHTTQGQKLVWPIELINSFLNWIENNYSKGVNGLPISWSKYNKK